MKCDTCKKEYRIDCDWNQGRCPMHPPQVNLYHMRYYNLFQKIKGWFNRGSST